MRHAGRPSTAAGSARWQITTQDMLPALSTVCQLVSIMFVIGYVNSRGISREAIQAGWMCRRLSDKNVAPSLEEQLRTVLLPYENDVR